MSAIPPTPISRSSVDLVNVRAARSSLEVSTHHDPPREVARRVPRSLVVAGACALALLVYALRSRWA